MIRKTSVFIISAGLITIISCMNTQQEVSNWQIPARVINADLQYLEYTKEKGRINDRMILNLDKGNIEQINVVNEQLNNSSTIQFNSAQQIIQNGSDYVEYNQNGLPVTFRGLTLSKYFEYDENGNLKSIKLSNGDSIAVAVIGDIEVQHFYESSNLENYWRADTFSFNAIGQLTNYSKDILPGVLNFVQSREIAEFSYDKKGRIHTHFAKSIRTIKGKENFKNYNIMYEYLDNGLNSKILYLDPKNGDASVYRTFTYEIIENEKKIIKKAFDKSGFLKRTVEYIFDEYDNLIKTTLVTKRKKIVEDRQIEYKK